MAFMKLRPAERVRLIKRIADILAMEDWAIIDLTLRQFGLPTLENWSSGRAEYVYHLTADATDDILIDLADYCHGLADAPDPAAPSAVAGSDMVGRDITVAAPTLGLVPSAEPRGPTTNSPALVEARFWKADTFKLFVSHLAAERVFAGELQQALARQGVSCFVAHNDIEPALDWQNQIEAALATCDALVALLHPNFHDSKWCDQEIGYAMGRGVPVFSVRLGTDPYGFIGRFQGLNGNGRSAAFVANELVNIICRHPQTQRVMAPIIVEQFAASTSYATARNWMDRLEALDHWEPSFSQRIIEAERSNNQVGKSNTVPERIAALVERWARVAA